MIVRLAFMDMPVYHLKSGRLKLCFEPIGRWNMTIRLTVSQRNMRFGILTTQTADKKDAISGKTRRDILQKQVATFSNHTVEAIPIHNQIKLFESVPRCLTEIATWKIALTPRMTGARTFFRQLKIFYSTALIGWAS